MPKLGLSLGLPTTKISAFDADALAYFATAGITDSTAQIQINDFVKGIKNLGLWSSMVSWPLRSSQNAGTGTTAYSLGGLQTASATISGGSWLSDGFSFSNTQYAQASLSSLNQDLTALICARGDGSTYGSFPQVFGVQGASTHTGNQINIGSNGTASDMGAFHRNSSTAGAYTGNGANPLNASTTFTFLSGTAKTEEILNYKILTTGATTAGGSPASAGTATLSRMQLNGRWTSGALALANPIICAFCAFVSPNISGSEASVYSLYKSTLGQGLGLP